MRIRFIYKLFFLCVVATTVASCNDDSETDVTYDVSKNAQIYNFTLSAIARTSEDTTNFAVLSKTRFSIDQTERKIYNPNPLPYKTSIRKYFPAFTFNGGTTLTVEVNYLANGVSVMSDSLVTWESTDSIDFSKKLQLVVTPPSGTPKRTYDVEIRAYQNDPDSIIWDKTQTQLPAAVATAGNTTKTFLLDNEFYTFVGSASALQLYTSPIGSPLVWTSKLLSNQPANAIVRTMIYANSNFYLLDTSNNIHTSSDKGLTWSTIANPKNVTAILGLLPKRVSQPLDEILVLLNNNTYGKTTDLLNINEITDIRGGLTTVSADFPRSDFSSYTNDEGSGAFNNQLIIVGGRNNNFQLTNITWFVKNSEADNALEILHNQGNKVLGTDSNGNVVADDIAIFYYNKRIYAYSQKKLYTSAFDWGVSWNPMASKQNPILTQTSIKGESILVDNNNNVWIIGGDKSNLVLKGKLNSFQAWNWIP